MRGLKTCIVVLCLASWAQADVAIFRTGEVWRGAIVWDKTTNSVTLAESVRPQSALLLLEKDDGSHLWSAGPAERVEGYRKLVFADRRKRLVRLTKDALSARDAKLARRLYTWVAREGLDEKTMRSLRKKVESLEKKRRPPKIKLKKRDAAEKAADGLRGALADLLVARAKQDKPAQLMLLRALLKDDPNHKVGLAMVRMHVPADFAFPPESWLPWHIELEQHGWTFTKNDLTVLERARHYWRPDLYAIEAPGVRIITPLRDLKRVAGIARRMQMTVAKLQTLFATKKPFKRARQPLTIHLFQNRKNFVNRTGYDYSASRAPYYQWRNGRFDLKEDVTRMFAKKDPTAKDTAHLHYITIHEVTRAWMWSHCPRYTSAQLMAGEPASGYGLVAGLFTFFAGAKFDLVRNRIDFSTRSAEYLKITARKERLFAWDTFFLMSSDDLIQIDNIDEERQKKRRTQIYLAQAFAYQGASTCHYLFNADGGRRRKALMDYIAHQYMGAQEKLNPRIALGARPGELGRSVLAWVAKP